MPKLKRGIFVGPQITKVMLDENFAKKLNSADWTGRVEILQVNSSWPSGQKRGKLPRNHTKSVTELPEVSCHWNSTSYIHISASLPENLEPSVMINMKCFLSIQQKSSNVVSEGGIRLWWGDYCCWWNFTQEKKVAVQNNTTLLSSSFSIWYLKQWKWTTINCNFWRFVDRASHYIYLSI